MRGCKSRTSMEWVSFYYREPEGQMVRELVRALGLKKCNFEFYSDGGGGWNCGAVLSGAMLVHSGICKNVLVFKARNRYSQGRAARGERANDVKGDAQFTTPFGIHHAASSFGPIATAHNGALRHHDPGLCPSRRHRAQPRRSQPKGNDAKAHHHRRPPELALDHLSIPVARLLPGERRRRRFGDHLGGAGARSEAGAGLYHVGHGRPGSNVGSWETNGANSAPLLYEGAGITPRDVSI